MDVAEETLDRLLADQPADRFLRFARAYLWTRRGEAQPALDGYQDAVLKAPPLPTTFLYLARLHRSMGNYEQAVSACRVGLEVAGEGSHPGDRISLYASLGIALDRLGREDESREAFDDGGGYLP